MDSQLQILPVIWNNLYPKYKKFMSSSLFNNHSTAYIPSIKQWSDFQEHDVPILNMPFFKSIVS